MKAPATLVNISPRDTDTMARKKPIGLPPNPKAFLTSQAPNRVDMPDAETSHQYGLPTPENRTNLKQRPTATSPLTIAPRIGIFSGKPRGVNENQASKLRAGWKTAHDILNIKK
ncbi:hypothetical protein [Burkholderia metallica]|uniref:hypothetical protein n=1 Tax=Burkholderia metallica TaxID=488729 RepID=UPI001CF5D079|nr:hypothetical protein [Burkholderia metallica]MCA8003496.1 hypothetical protein [Burkholderia metallica]